MLERMSDFFSARRDGYDEHMRRDIEGAAEFYRFTAERLPKTSGAAVLDLGCGTGIELEEYLVANPAARIVGIDLCSDMLDALSAKFPENDGLELICGSYFDIPFGENRFDAAVSVESLHHFTAKQKLPLYQKLRKSLKCGGYFVLTDYFAESDAKEREYFETFARLRREQGIGDREFYHYDTPLTVGHEIDVLHAAGFSLVETLQNWGTTYCVAAYV